MYQVVVQDLSHMTLFQSIKYFLQLFLDLFFVLISNLVSARCETLSILRKSNVVLKNLQLCIGILNNFMFAKVNIKSQ